MDEGTLSLPWHVESNTELSEVVIKVLVHHHSPTAPRNPAEHAARRPVGRGATSGKALHQVAEAADVGFPGGRTGGKEVRWAFALALGPGYNVDGQPVDRWVCQRSGGRSGLEFSETVAKLAADVAHHFWSSKPAPERFRAGGKTSDAIDDGISNVGGEE